MDKDARIAELERAISDFKAYDAERTIYLRRVEKENAEVQERNDRLTLDNENLSQKIDTLIDSYDKAGLMKDNSGNKAYVKELLDRICVRPMSTKSLEQMESALAREVVSLRKGMRTLQGHCTELSRENARMKRALNILTND